MLLKSPFFKRITQQIQFKNINVIRQENSKFGLKYLMCYSFKKWSLAPFLFKTSDRNVYRCLIETIKKIVTLVTLVTKVLIEVIFCRFSM